MVLERKSLFLYFSFLLYIFRPTFYFYGYIFGRLSDMIGILTIIIFIFLYIQERRQLINISNNALFFILLCLAYIFIMLVSYFINNFIFSLTFKDLVELSRPIFFLFIFLAGYLFTTNDNYFKLIKLIIFAGFVNSTIGALEFFYSEYFSFFYKIYSVPNLLRDLRSGGIVYSHTEYTAFSAFASAVGFAYYFNNKKSIYLVTSLYTLAFSVLSFSKAGLIYLIILYVLFLLYTIVISKSIFLKLFILIIFIVLVIIGTYFIIETPYIYTGINALMNIENTKNLSVLNRLHDIYNVLDILKEGDYRLWIGSTPLRDYKEISYIEVSVFNILFRFGIFGFLIYYFIILYPCFIKNKYNNLYLNVLVFHSLALVVADFTANISETIKFSYLFLLLYGSTIKYLKIKKDEKHVKTNC